MTELQLERINELARKEKSTGLTPAEKEEQRILRQNYIAAVRRNLRSQLDQIDMIEPDGSVVNLGKLHNPSLKDKLN